MPPSQALGVPKHWVLSAVVMDSHSSKRLASMLDFPWPTQGGSLGARLSLTHPFQCSSGCPSMSHPVKVPHCSLPLPDSFLGIRKPGFRLMLWNSPYPKEETTWDPISTVRALISSLSESISGAGALTAPQSLHHALVCLSVHGINNFSSQHFTSQ